MLTPDDFNKRSAGHLPGHLGILTMYFGPAEVRAELDIQNHHIAPNGFLHAGSVVTLADTASGYGCIANCRKVHGVHHDRAQVQSPRAPPRGHRSVRRTAVHLGRTTQVWDAVVTNKRAAGRSHCFAAPR